MKTKRINKGIYEVSAKGRTFTVEQVADGSWQLVEELTYSSEYWNHFATKRDCLQAIEAELSV